MTTDPSLFSEPSGKINLTDELGLAFPQITYADLFSSEGLHRLDQIWLTYLAQQDPALAKSYQAGRDSKQRDALSSVEISSLLCQVAPWVSKFIQKLFGREVQEQANAILLATQKELRLLKFKEDFVKRRALKRPALQNQQRSQQAGIALLHQLGCQHGPDKYQVDEARLNGYQVDEPQFDSYQFDSYQFDSYQFDESQVAEVTLRLLEQENLLLSGSAEQPELIQVRSQLDIIADFILSIKDSSAFQKRWLSLQFPHSVDYQNLVPLRRPDKKQPELFIGLAEHQKHRDGFDLTEEKPSSQVVLDQVDYCIYCHIREKDSCSKGLIDKSGQVKKNPLGIPLAGCPLEEKISEMHTLRRQGDPIAALALICVDNPLCPGTGHRICNDCMKSCIYQKQEPVNIPQTETGILTEVLSLPWGVEIYGLLTRFNPLHLKRPYPLPYNGRKVLVVGLGPAGYTLAHYLAKEGFGVIGIDGLKLEPPPQPETGDVRNQLPPSPIKDYQKISSPLSNRTILGFGGVSEYGITARYDKNFLTLLYITLSRQENIRFYGGIRFGGTLTLEDAWALGFDHVALATGAGSPTLIPMKNNLCRGIRQASDFLMSLQLSGAYQSASLANLQIRLPALVIGGGLTAIDTATELQAYYITQVEKTLSWWEELFQDHPQPCFFKKAVEFKNEHPQVTTGLLQNPDLTDEETCPLCKQQEQKLLSYFTEEERTILQEQLAHGIMFRQEKALAQKEKREPHFSKLIEDLGGVTLIYRKSLPDSPAYRLNHEEVRNSLAEGIFYREDLAPIEACVDSFGALSAFRFSKQAKVNGIWQDTGEEITLPARTACIAAGTKPNITYEKEYPGTFLLGQNGYFIPHHAHLANSLELSLTPHPQGVFTSYLSQGHTVSFYGDNHPYYAGSVVKAMASAKNGYQQVAALYPSSYSTLIHDLFQQSSKPEQTFIDSVSQSDRMEPLSTQTSKQERTFINSMEQVTLMDDSLKQPSTQESFLDFCRRLDQEFLAYVVAINRLAPSIVEVVVKAPLAAKKFQPGQFYRLQNFAKTAPLAHGIPLVMEGLALTGACTDPEKGLLSLIVLEMGGSSNICQFLTPGEPLLVMGPTGTPTDIPQGEQVCLVGGGLGNAVLLSIASALKKQGCRVLYFAGYRKPEDLFKQQDIEDATDQVIWACDQEPDPKLHNFSARRPQDQVFVGNIVAALVAYAQGSIGNGLFSFPQLHRMIVIGSDKMMAAVQKAKNQVLKPYLHPNLIGIASINSPMQCMMKEICAQCLQRQVDPKTGQEQFVFSCVNQDQEIDGVDFSHLAARLQQNSMQEKLTHLWIEHILHQK